MALRVESGLNMKSHFKHSGLADARTSSPVMTGVDGCRICGNVNNKVLYRIKPFNVVECLGCKATFIVFKEEYKETRELYSPDYYREREEYFLKNCVVDPLNGKDNPNIKDFKEGLQVIESYKSVGRLLDVGCAMGVFLALAKQRKWECFGVDLSEYAIEFAKKEFGLDCFAGPLKEAKLPDNHFDVITLWDSIEHFERPVEELKELKRVLADDGILLLNTPNVESLTRLIVHWLYVVTGGTIKYPVEKLYHRFHLYYFSPATLTFLLDKAGFRVVEMKKKNIPIIKARGNKVEKLVMRGLSFLERVTNREYELFVVAQKG